MSTRSTPKTTKTESRTLCENQLKDVNSDTLPKAAAECGTVHSRKLYLWIRDEASEPYFPGGDRWDEIVWFPRAA